MGQKTNPNIYQLGKTRSWDSKFIEKKPLEISKYSFKKLELNKFILKFFEDNGLHVYTCKFFFSNDTISIFVSYFVNYKTAKLAQTSKKLKLKKHKKNKKLYFKKTKKTSKKIFFQKKKILFSKFLRLSIKNRILFFKVKKYTKKRNMYFEQTINKFRKPWSLKKTKAKTFDSILKFNFLNQIFKNINTFFLEKPKINLIFQQLNTFAKKDYSKKEIVFIKKNLGKLRQFNDSSFLKEGLQIIILTLKNNNSSDFLARYISKELQKHKKQHFFLNFVQKAFEIFNKKEFCTPKNIKIKVKGRFNGVPRSKKRILLIGNPIPIIKLSTKVNYSQSTSFSSNGTFGIKIWMSETNKKQ